MKMIDSWMADDLETLEALIERVGSNYGAIFWLLIVVLGGTIDTIARMANKTFDEVLPGLMVQMAERTESSDAGDLARRALTAWSSGDDELIESLDFDTDLEQVGPHLVLIHLLGMLGTITRSWTEKAKISPDEVRAGWAISLIGGTGLEGP